MAERAPVCGPTIPVLEEENRRCTLVGQLV